MRFPVEHVKRIRRGEITATLRPLMRQRLLDGWQNQVRSPQYEPGRIVPIQRVDDVRRERDDGGAEYDQVIIPTDEHIEITTLSKLFTTAVPGAAVEACGFETLDDLIADFLAWYPGRRDRLAWLVWFRFVPDLHHYVDAKPSAQDPDKQERAEVDRGYTRNLANALSGEDAPAVDMETLENYAAKNRERFAEERAAHTQADELRNLGVRLKELQRRQRQKGVDCTLGIAHMKRQIEDLERRMDEAA